MKKEITLVIVLLAILTFSMSFIANVHSQTMTTDVQVLSYTVYTSPSSGDLEIVGEIQNTGPNILQYVRLDGTIYISNGTAEASGFTQAYVADMLPQQKAPFSMDIPPDLTLTQDFSWLQYGLGNVTYVAFANVTTETQYQGMKIIGNTSFTDPTTNLFSVTGVVQNVGNQDAGNWWTVVGTFYNSSGSAIGWGASDYLTPASFPPNQTASFTVEPRDITTDLNSQITSYSIMLQNVVPPDASSSPSPSASGTPTPTTSISPSSSPTVSPSASTQPTSSPAQTSFPTSLLIVLVVVIVVLVAAVVVLLVRKRPSTKPT
jgi:hypothetical protein